MRFPIRRARPDDAVTLAQHRARLWRTEGGWGDEIFDQIGPWSDAFADFIADETYCAWIVEDGENAVGSGGVLVRITLPRPGRVSRREGRVHGMWVEPAYRRGGIARAIMREVLAFATERDFLRLSLHPTELARPLYESLGFDVADEMTLAIPVDPPAEPHH